jgi:hypothetical protein
MKSTKNVIEDLLSQLISFSREQQQNLNLPNSYANRQIIREELQTINIRGPRRSGHSTAMINVIKTMKLNALIIAINERMVEKINGLLRDNNIDTTITVISQYDLESFKGTEQEYDIIFVDNYSYINDDNTFLYELALVMPFLCRDICNLVLLG